MRSKSGGGGDAMQDQNTVNCKPTETCYIALHHFVIIPGDCTDGKSEEKHSTRACVCLCDVVHTLTVSLQR